jgi:hypothetical protein
VQLTVNSVTCTVCQPAVSAPVRVCEPVLGATVKLTVPLPEPLTGDTGTIHGTAPATDHGQPAAAEISRLPAPPLAGNGVPVAFRLELQNCMAARKASSMPPPALP